MLFFIKHESETFPADNNFRPLKKNSGTLEVRNPDLTPVVHIIYRTSKIYGLIPAGKFIQGYIIEYKGQTFTLDTIYFRALTKHSKEATKVVEYLQKAYPEEKEVDLKVGKGANFINTMLLLVIIFGFLASFLSVLFTTSLKNFSSETIKISDNSNPAEGSYAQIDAMVFDMYSTESVETSKTGKETTSKGDSYLLVMEKSAFEAAKKDSSKNVPTYILRVLARSDLVRKLESDDIRIYSEESQDNFASIEDFKFKLSDMTPYAITLQGQIDKISELPKMDKGQQIADYFNESVGDIEQTNKPALLIDTRYSLDTYQNALLWPGILLVATIIVIAAKIGYERYHASQISLKFLPKAQ